MPKEICYDTVEFTYIVLSAVQSWKNENIGAIEKDDLMGTISDLIKQQRETQTD